MLSEINGLIGGGPAAKSKPKPEEKTASQPASGSTAQAKLQAYYNRSPRKKAEADPNNPIVNCKLGSGSQYLRRYDCELRGGRET